MNTTKTIDPETDTAEIGRTILKQIHAADVWAQARWGVKDKLAMETGLMLNCTKGIKIIVTLDPSDTYTVQVGKYSRKDFAFKPAGEAAGIYVDNLVHVIDSLFSKAFGHL